MISKNEINAFKFLPTTVTNLARTLRISTAAASKTTDKLVSNTLATKQRNGKTILVQKERTTLAQKLDELNILFPRLPLDTILTYTTLTLIASLTYPLTAEELAKTIGVTRQWVHKTIRRLSSHGILIKTNDTYTINPLHQKIADFAQTYIESQHYRTTARLATDAVILWQHGNEVLFKTKQHLPDVQQTAVTATPNYDLPFIDSNNYYFITNRHLTTADHILHLILIDPTSKTYNAYALLTMEKTTPSDLKKKARLYNLTSHLATLEQYLKDHTPTARFLPDWNDYEHLAQQYGVP